MRGRTSKNRRLSAWLRRARSARGPGIHFPPGRSILGTARRLTLSPPETRFPPRTEHSPAPPARRTVPTAAGDPWALRAVLTRAQEPPVSPRATTGPLVPVAYQTFWTQLGRWAGQPSSVIKRAVPRPPFDRELGRSAAGPAHAIPPTRLYAGRPQGTMGRGEIGAPIVPTEFAALPDFSGAHPPAQNSGLLQNRSSCDCTRKRHRTGQPPHPPSKLPGIIARGPAAAGWHLPGPRSKPGPREAHRPLGPAQKPVPRPKMMDEYHTKIIRGNSAGKSRMKSNSPLETAQARSTAWWPDLG